MRIIPAIDIINGKCVRLSQGDYSTQKVYNDSPLDMAKRFEAHGVKYLHVVDLDGAVAQKIINWKSLEAICLKTSLVVDFGGGVKTNEAIQTAFDCGANQVTCGSIAIKDSALFLTWLKKYGSQKIILGADTKKQKIAVNGWEETTEVDLFYFLKKYISEGVENVICTDIEKDGMLSGSSGNLYEEIIQKFPTIKLIASGGVDGIDDLKQLKKIGLEGAIIGKAIYENRIPLVELEKFIINN